MTIPLPWPALPDVPRDRQAGDGQPETDQNFQVLATSAAARGNITDGDIQAGAGIAYSKLALADSVKYSDLAKDADGLAVGAFRATGGGTPTCAVAAHTIIAGNGGGYTWTVSYNVSGWFDVTTGQFTPLVKGLWHVFGAVQFNSTAANNAYAADVFQNGGLLRQLEFAHTSTANPVIPSGDDVFAFNGTTDFVQLGYYASSAATFGNGGTTFGAHLIGRLS